MALRHLGSLPKPCRARQYIALKVYVHTSLVHRELPSYRHISRLIADSSHEGRSNIRTLLDSFEVTGPHGNHIVLVFEAAQMSLRDMKLVFRQDGFDEDLVRGAIIELLKALDFLHTQGEVIHTGISYILLSWFLACSSLISCRCTQWQHAPWHF